MALSVKTYMIQIWVGLRIGYSDELHSLDDVRKICTDWLSKNNDCLTITPTEFHYVNGNEPGVIVGFIQYPRFLREEDEILRHALDLGELLRVGLGQQRVSITTPSQTIMLGDEF